MSPTIKFSHDYAKFPNDFKHTPYAQLLQLFIVDKSELSDLFIWYDTKIRSGDYYRLPDGKLILLLFVSNIDEQRLLFTTIRRYTKEKYEYYLRMVGAIFHIKYPRR